MGIVRILIGVVLYFGLFPVLSAGGGGGGGGGGSGSAVPYISPFVNLLIFVVIVWFVVRRKK